MYLYLAELNNQDNRREVAAIIEPILEADILNDEIARENVASLDRLNALGEQKIKDMVVERMKGNPLYKKYLN